ncbi:sulfurtransferase [Kineosporia babensis]|uniref:Sulfurtransferase n=1 Tax=Kineosporia babensis TaxID=499548 RepID=A0A9X1NJJ6_9ACTN|nr:sulfurtransferase [Kineosporia babensis]MCD5314969.1 sulfurtransferase [Kineosporia babensis]
MTTALISAQSLAQELGDPRLRILDASTVLNIDENAGTYVGAALRGDYEQGHVPGAVLADVPGVLSAPGATYAFTLPTPEYFAQQIGALGVGNDSRVVVYDADGGAWATRVWWLLRVFGHDDVRVLDGGKQAWVAAGQPLEKGNQTAAAASFVPSFRSDLVATTDEVAQADACLINALDPATFRGEQEVSPYPRRGRIPGSQNLPFYTLKDPDTGKLLPVEQLREALESSGLLTSPRAITYCGGGIAASLVTFAAYVAGREDVAIYDGSLSEWTGDPSRPVVLGA